MKIVDYIQRLDIINNTLFRIGTDGKGHFIYEGKEYTREQFRQMFPTLMSFVSYNKPNSDTSHNFLHTD
jgi:hypothetical protein